MIKTQPGSLIIKHKNKQNISQKLQLNRVNQMLFVSE